jgi:hypothetical protein
MEPFYDRFRCSSWNQKTGYKLGFLVWNAES